MALEFDTLTSSLTLQTSSFTPFSAPPMSTTQATPMASILATLGRHVSVTQSYLPPHLSSNTPLFDSTTPSNIPHNAAAECAKQISSLGLPAPLASEVAAAAAQESEQYLSFVEQVRLRVLHELSTVSAAPNPSTIPSLVEAACNAFHGALTNSIIGDIQQQISSSLADGTEPDADDQSGSDSDSGSSIGSNDGDEEDGELFDQAEEDDNAPIKPGEDIPPLETKYLPIFEALHERGKVLTKPEKTYLVNMTGMTYRQITIWFQNRRRGELKENLNASTYSRASSAHSDESSELSEHELEKNLESWSSNATFDIRSWRLQSALATKDHTHAATLPPSPIKQTFSTGVDTPDTQTDDSDLSDSENELNLPPGLPVPSLSMSVTTIDSSRSASANGASSSMARGSFWGSSTTADERPDGATGSACSRSFKGLPSLLPSRHGASPAFFQQTQLGQTQPTRVLSVQNGVSETPIPPSQLVTSDERGLTVSLNTTPPIQATTLRSPIGTSPALANLPISTPVVSSSPPSSTESPNRQPSPAMSRHSTSPRPHIKPLPRRTGCAPRPRPPPRAGSASIPVPAPGVVSSARPSVILPPSSNPTLGTTTLGALLRPNPPAPSIPPEIEERLTAMAGRMGVGTYSGPSSTPGHSVSPNTPVLSRSGIILGTSFSFGPIALPKTGASQGARAGSVLGHAAPDSANSSSS